MITIYDAGKKGAVITEPFSARRMEGKAETALPACFSVSKDLHTWLSFMSSDGKKVSDSVYVRLET